MSPFVDFQIFRTGKNFAASRKRTRERLFAGMDADVIDQLVFGLKWAPIATAFLPKANVILGLRTSDMFHRQMGDNFVHTSENSAARFFRSQARVLIDPHASHGIIPVISVGAHVAEKRRPSIRSLESRVGTESSRGRKKRILAFQWTPSGRPIVSGAGIRGAVRCRRVRESGRREKRRHSAGLRGRIQTASLTSPPLFMFNLDPQKPVFRCLIRWVAKK